MNIVSDTQSDLMLKMPNYITPYFMQFDSLTNGKYEGPKRIIIHTVQRTNAKQISIRKTFLCENINFLNVNNPNN